MVNVNAFIQYQLHVATWITARWNKVILKQFSGIVIIGPI